MFSNDDVVADNSACGESVPVSEERGGSFSETEMNASDAGGQDSSTQRHLLLAGRSIILVGTAHVSAKSIEEVESAIFRERPDTVAIELDQKRLESMRDPESWRKMDIISVLKKKQGFLMLANLVLASYQKRMGSGADVTPGAEMAAAVRCAQSLGIPCSMVDRPIAVTLRRAWAKNSLWGKCKLLSALLASAFSKEQPGQEEIENLKRQSEMDSMMEELSDYLPAVKEVLIDERDFYLASNIWQCGGDKILAVLGAGHLPGVQAHLERLAAGTESADCSGISGVPAKSIGSKIAAWIIPVLIVALIVMGFVYGGIQAGKEMLGAWFLWNGILAGLGAVIAGGHPLTVLVSVLGAPFTSLCPFVGIGIASGIVQALVHKPTVSDMERLSQDAAGLKFYKNRILRVLLVFTLSSIGSSLGTFVAGASFVRTISGFFDNILQGFVKG